MRLKITHGFNRRDARLDTRIAYITRAKKTNGYSSVARSYPRNMDSPRNPESQCCLVVRDVNAPHPAPSKFNIDMLGV